MVEAAVCWVVSCVTVINTLCADLSHPGSSDTSDRSPILVLFSSFSQALSFFLSLSVQIPPPPPPCHLFLSHSMCLYKYSELLLYNSFFHKWPCAVGWMGVKIQLLTHDSFSIFKNIKNKIRRFLFLSWGGGGGGGAGTLSSLRSDFFVVVLFNTHFNLVCETATHKE